MAKRPTPKVSAARGMSIDAWVKAKAGAQGALVKKLIAVAKKAAPSANLLIKWNQPVFEQNGPFAFIKPAKAHVSFGFWRGGELSDPEGALEGGATMKHVKVPAGGAIDEAMLTRLVREAVSLNESKGDPTKR